MSTQELDVSAEGWKETISEENMGFLEWERDLVFNARTQRGYEVDFDAEMQWGCSPTETLLISVAGCMAIDVTFFLKKMRATISSFKIEFSGKRRLEPPQFYKSIDMNLKVAGSGITSKKVERAIALSQDKYCSVYHSLRKDIQVSINYEIVDNSN